MALSKLTKDYLCKECNVVHAVEAHEQLWKIRNFTTRVYQEKSQWNDWSIEGPNFDLMHATAVAMELRSYSRDRRNVFINLVPNLRLRSDAGVRIQSIRFHIVDQRGNKEHPTVLRVLP